MVSLVATRQLPAELEILAERIVYAMRKEAAIYTAPSVAPKIVLDTVVFTLIIDPCNQLPGYEGVWRNANNDRCGILMINSDNSFYAEYDLFCPHPRDERWFVEMVTAWGRDETLRCEAKLIPRL